jgi:hypothetical protein
MFLLPFPLALGGGFLATMRRTVKYGALLLIFSLLQAGFIGLLILGMNC